jgi:hypothetical protein
MSINTNDLNAEREVLVKDFEALQQCCSWCNSTS